MLLTFVPLMTLMFVLLALLEDSGYLARAAVVTDRLMRRIGLPGRAFLPLIVGYGCNVPAISGTRILPNARHRILTALLVPFTACSARLTVFVMMGAIFFGPYPSGTLKGGHYDLGMSAWVAGPDPENYALWHSSQIPPKGQNNSHFVNAEMDRLQEEGTRVLKRADRAKIYHRSAEILAEDLPMIPLLYWADINPVNKRVSSQALNTPTTE